MVWCGVVWCGVEGCGVVRRGGVGSPLPAPPPTHLHRLSLKQHVPSPSPPSPTCIAFHSSDSSPPISASLRSSSRAVKHAVTASGIGSLARDSTKLSRVASQRAAYGPHALPTATSMAFLQRVAGEGEGGAQAFQAIGWLNPFRVKHTSLLNPC